MGITKRPKARGEGIPLRFKGSRGPGGRVNGRGGSGLTLWTVLIGSLGLIILTGLLEPSKLSGFTENSILMGLPEFSLFTGRAEIVDNLGEGK